MIKQIIDNLMDTFRIVLKYGYLYFEIVFSLLILQYTYARLCTTIFNMHEFLCTNVTHIMYN